MDTTIENDAAIGEDAAVEEHGRMRGANVLLVALLLLALASGALFLWWSVQPRGDTGSYLVPQGSMTDEEAQALVDRQAELSRITVSVRPVQELVDGKLHVNFVVPAGNNNFSERIEIEQDGRVVYRSGVVTPEHVIEWGDAPQAHAGAATATIYAIDSSGNDFGNPVSVEVEIA